MVKVVNAWVRSAFGNVLEHVPKEDCKNYTRFSILFPLKEKKPGGKTATSCNFPRHPLPAWLYANEVGSDLIFGAL